MRPDSCTCPDTSDGSGDQCIRGVLYGYCEWFECGGACESFGSCSCELHEGLGDAEGIEHDSTHWPVV